MPGKLQSQEFTASGTFNVPSGVTAVWLTMIAGGGAGGGTAPASGGGTNASGAGGSGEICQRVMKIVPSGGTVTVTIGAGGTQGINGLQPGNSGGNTSFGSFFVRSASLDNRSTTNPVFLSSGGWDFSLGGGGAGGGAGGPPNNTRGTSFYIGTNSRDGQCGVHGAPCWQGGGQGGCGDSAGIPVGRGGFGAPESGYPRSSGGVAASGGGGGGASTLFGSGPVGVTSGFGTNATSTVYGSGGGGAGANGANALGGTGAPGYCLVQWIS